MFSVKNRQAYSGKSPELLNSPDKHISVLHLEQMMKPSLRSQHKPLLPQFDPEQVHAVAFQMITGHFNQTIVNPNLQPPNFQTPGIEKFGVEMFCHLLCRKI